MPLKNNVFEASDCKVASAKTLLSTQTPPALSWKVPCVKFYESERRGICSMIAHQSSGRAECNLRRSFEDVSGRVSSALPIPQ